MAYPEHWLLSFGGPLGTLGEQWSNNIRFMPEVNGAPVPDYGQDEGILDDLEQDITTHMANTASKYSTVCKLGYIKFNKIGTNGKYANPSTSVARYFDPTPLSPSTAATSMPPHISLCVSFRTTADRGYASKGRLYIPQPAIVLGQNSGLISTTDTTAVAGAWKTFLENLGNWPGLDLPESPLPHVVSGIGAGVGREIRQVRVGNIPDVQNRRRNALEEAYATADLVPGSAIL